MVRNMKIIAVLLTLLLLFLVFWGIYKGIAFSPLFWIIYIALAIADWQSIQWLKRKSEKQ